MTNSDKTIICLHGRWGRAETWVDFMDHYANRYRIVAPDQRGHGLSDKPISTYSIEEMADDIVKMADQLDIKRCIVVGHSMGGGIAAYLAANYSERIVGIAILDKSPKGPPKKCNIPPEEIAVVDPISKNWPMPFSSRSEALFYINRDMESDYSRRYFENSLCENADGVYMMYSNYAIAANIANYHEWYDILPEIRCPTVIMRSGSHEAVDDKDFEIMKKEIPKVMSYEIPHPDHNVHLTRKTEFYAFFDSFLDSLD